jgi:hypothetical protein
MKRTNIPDIIILLLPFVLLGCACYAVSTGDPKLIAVSFFALVVTFWLIVQIYK